MKKQYCKVREDLIEQGLAVPAGDILLGKGTFEYRWVGDIFQVKVGEEWLEAESIDFEFYDITKTRV